MFILRTVRHVQTRKTFISHKRFKTDSWEKFLTPAEQKRTEERWKEAVTDFANRNETNTSGSEGENAKEKKKKKYILAMFPYPSGNLHLGHARVYTISDALASFYRMNGWEVIHPMGWDAFGLPAENAAMERGENPLTWTRANIRRMRSQLRALGCGFDWHREIATCDPRYYRWTQFIFLKLYHAGLAYRQQALVNWDPVDETVLANEQVDERGRSWRSGAEVEQRRLTQWFLKATCLSKELYDDLSSPCLVGWRDVPSLQRHWIGQATGYVVEMNVRRNEADTNVHETSTNVHRNEADTNVHKNEVNRNVHGNEASTISTTIPGLSHLSVWMSEPEKLEHVSFIAIKSSHILNQTASQGHCTLLHNMYAINPISGRNLPLVVCDTLDYAEERDVYAGIPAWNEADRNVCVRLGLPALPPPETSLPDREDVLFRLSEANSGGYACHPKLRDWLVSRQRFWGTPIPVVYCPKCGTVPVPEEDLPVLLPEFEGNVRKGKSVLRESPEWRKCPCPRCGSPSERETDTLDTFVDSSWYFLRFLDSRNEALPFGRAVVDRLMPVDLYIGGKEHATLHLYYARFMQKFLAKCGLASHKEPFKRLLLQGMVKGKSFQVKETGRYLTREQVDFSVSPPVEKESGRTLVIQYEKMSKSKYNGVDPQALLDEYGVDAVRLAMLANVGPQSDRLWDPEDMKQSFQIMSKLWGVTRQFVLTREEGGASLPGKSEEESAAQDTLLFETRNRLVARATHNFGAVMQFHSVIRTAQEMLAALLRVSKSAMLGDEYGKTLKNVLLILTPVCPHLTAELWKRISRVEKGGENEGEDNIFLQPWPRVDPSYKLELSFKVNEEEVYVARLEQSTFSSLSEERAKEIALDHPLVSPLIKGEPMVAQGFTFCPNYKATLSIQTTSKKNIKKKKKEKRKGKEKLSSS